MCLVHGTERCAHDEGWQHAEGPTRQLVVKPPTAVLVDRALLEAIQRHLWSSGHGVPPVIVDGHVKAALALLEAALK